MMPIGTSPHHPHNGHTCNYPYNYHHQKNLTMSYPLMPIYATNPPDCYKILHNFHA